MAVNIHGTALDDEVFRFLLSVRAEDRQRAAFGLRTETHTDGSPDFNWPAVTTIIACHRNPQSMSSAVSGEDVATVSAGSKNGPAFAPVGAVKGRPAPGLSRRRMDSNPT